MHPEQPVPPTPPPARLRVLIVDAIPLTRVGIVSVIERLPRFSVCGVASEGTAARELCVGEKPDLILLDLEVPGGGLALLRDFYKLHPAVRVVVLSAEKEAVLVERALRAGARGYLSNLAEVDELRAALDSVLAGKVFLCRRASQWLVSEMAHGSLKGMGRRVHELSDRELQVFRLIGNGVGASAIARELRVSVKTVETHQQRIKEKLRAGTGEELRRQAMLFARRSGKRGMRLPA